jgi:Amt family ammonium transporter
MSSSNDLQLANLTVELSKLKSQLKTMNENMAENNNAFFLVTMALIIFLMQCGFAFLEAGTVRSKNTTNILIKNLLDSCEFL